MERKKNPRKQREDAVLQCSMEEEEIPGAFCYSELFAVKSKQMSSGITHGFAFSRSTVVSKSGNS